MSNFDIFPDVTGQYRWRLIANNGEIVATSEAYVSHDNAIRSAHRVKELASSATIAGKTAIELIARVLRNR